jgi:hypothetical protein
MFNKFHVKLIFFHHQSFQKVFQDETIPYSTIDASDKPRYVKNRISKKLDRFIALRSNLFERIYPIKPQLAQNLIDIGYLHYSKFGKFCPVSVGYLHLIFRLIIRYHFSYIMVIVFHQHLDPINHHVQWSIESMFIIYPMRKLEMTL